MIGDCYFRRNSKINIEISIVIVIIMIGDSIMSVKFVYNHNKSNSIGEELKQLVVDAKDCSTI